MKLIYNEQTLEVVIEDVKDFNITQTLTCGQCFRWIEQDADHFRGVVKGCVIDIYQLDQTTIKLSRVTKEFFESNLIDYFDLNRDYSKIKKTLIKNDTVMKKAVSHGAGIRILNQSVFETIMSFIISGNNNIPRIMKAIDGISKTYGSYIETIDDIAYYSFPTPEQLAEVTIEDYRAQGVGYRDQYLYHMVQYALEHADTFESLSTYENEALREALLSLKGIGPKIADCILLFAFHRMYAFPVDTWVKKIMKTLYLEQDTKDKEILAFAEKKFGDYAGIAQQYLFYYSRSSKL